ncbi:membrane protein insertion efficiency factor YidD [Buchananella felis]|uniref:membrane protein insertion efficiency factor YidD n=1 Tax=Buchananella felis TaxID=3231492 RepID=UPI003529A773
MKRILLGMIAFYQDKISAGRPRTCRYYPTCSAYAAGAVKQHGVGKGILLTTWRLLRCWPWSPGGVDMVPLPGRWRSTDEQNRTLPDGTKIDL